MNTENKGRAWYGKFYRKLETGLVEGNVSLESSESAGLDSVRDEREKFAEDHCSDTLDMNDRVEQPISSQCSTNDSNPISLVAETLAAPVQDKVANLRAFTTNSVHVNQDEFFIDDFDDAPLESIDLYDMTFREDPSDFDDSLLYAARDKTRQLRSFKRKIMDALTSKRQREKEYEQLAIWFGDADMGCDLINTKEHATKSLDSKSSQSNEPFTSEDSDWELL